MTGAEIFDLIIGNTGIDKEHLRITCGYKEIIPNDQTYKLKDEELLLTKLRLLGGSATSERNTEPNANSELDNWDLLL